MNNKKPYNLTISNIKNNGYLLFETIVGSQAYGTNTSESDTDIKGVFVMPEEFELKLSYDSSWDVILHKEGEGNKKVETEYFTLRKFMKLLINNNPAALEMLHTPEDCITYMHPDFKLIYDNRDKFLTTKCEKAFAEFAIQQMKKAKGQDKKQNWTKERMTRKDLLDFCYTFQAQGSIPVKDKLKQLGITAESCGLVRIPHMTNTFAVYHDENESYKGIVARGETDIILSSVKRNASPIFYMQFNSNAWSTHCVEIREWKTWEKERNEDRWVDVQGHGQKIDGKNMLHSVRLIDTAIEIVTTGTLNVRRPNVPFLLDIKKGRLTLQEILENSEQKILDMSNVYKQSNLPKELNADFLISLDEITYSLTKKVREEAIKF